MTEKQKRIATENSQNKYEKLINEIQTLVDSISQLQKVAEKKFSLKASFLRGIMQGIGIVFGSTVLATILLAILSKFITLQDIIRIIDAF